MKTVFLIDDDEDDREIFEEALNSLAFPVFYSEAVNGLDALEKLSNPEFKTPDIIFLDLNMPKMDGRQFLVEIKKSSKLSHIPVVIYSTSSNARDIHFTLENKAAKFITKHHSITQLRSELEKTLQDF